MKQAFTLKELFVLTVVVCTAGLFVLMRIDYYKEELAYSNTVHELRQIQQAVYAYQEDNRDEYPAETQNTFPPELEVYFKATPVDGDLSNAPFPGSYYDWDNWTPDDLIYPPFENVRQISIRFCNADTKECLFPKAEWAEGFDEYSAIFLCLEGPCRAHASKQVTHPGYRVN